MAEERYREVIEIVATERTEDIERAQKRIVALQRAVYAATSPMRALSRTIGTLTSPLRALTGALGGVAKIASGFIVGQALYALPGLLMDAAKAAAADQASVLKLQQAVTNTGAAWETYADQLAATVDNAIRLGFADQDSRDALSLL